MLSRKVLFALLVFSLFGSFATAVWPDCHDNHACENIPGDIWSGWYRDEPNDNEVEYLINPTRYEDVPDLTTDRGSNRLRDVDIIINYKAPFDTHGNVDDDEVCIRDTATHEFGHFIGLLDLVPKYVGGRRLHCRAYERYTMWQPVPLGDHDKETIECEEKWVILNEVYPRGGD